MFNDLINHDQAEAEGLKDIGGKLSPLITTPLSLGKGLPISQTKNNGGKSDPYPEPENQYPKMTKNNRGTESTVPKSTTSGSIDALVGDQTSGYNLNSLLNDLINHDQAEAQKEKGSFFGSLAGTLVNNLIGYGKGKSTSSIRRMLEKSDSYSLTEVQPPKKTDKNNRATTGTVAGGTVDRANPPMAGDVFTILPKILAQAQAQEVQTQLFKQTRSLLLPILLEALLKRFFDDGQVKAQEASMEDLIKLCQKIAAQMMMKN